MYYWFDFINIWTLFNRPSQTIVVGSQADLLSMDKWINGIHWFNELGYEAMVEVSEHTRCVTVVVSQDIRCRQFFCSLIEKVCNLQRCLCPAYKTTTYLISPEMRYVVVRIELYVF